VILTTGLAAVGIALAGALLVSALRRSETMRSQLMALALAAVLLPIAAVVLSSWGMLSGNDALHLAVVAIVSAATASALAATIASWTARKVERFRDAAVALSAGDLSVRLPEVGPAELHDLAAAFNEMARSLARLFDTRRNMFAWATHDLRTPLASLQAMIEALEDGLAPAEDYLPEMRRQVRQLSMLVDDLFELSRIESGSLALDIAEIQLIELAEGCVRSLRPQAEMRGIRLEIAGDPDARARCAPDKVERVLLNLLTNALRHTPHDGTVAVRVAGGGPSVTVAVEDSGDGLPAGARERVFETFWRADRARHEAGAGLGLAIARGLVEAHGGRIWAENRPEGGARFAFTLPA
jgi:signal transduction histidine kinase